MITYLLNVRMADSSLTISDQMLSIISDCTKLANSTIVSMREKRTFEVIGRNPEDNESIQIKLTSKNPVNPTRSLSTLSRRVIENEYMAHLLKGHTPNGSVFKAELIDTDEDASITYKSDTDIVSEIVSIFFDNTLLPKEKELASNTAEQIRTIVINYLNKKNNL